MTPRLIVGSGRSGTTWVLDALADANEIRPIFEPLHPGESSLGERYAYRAIAHGDNHEALEYWFRELAASRIRSRWIDYRGPTGLLFPHPRRFMTAGFARRWLRGWRNYINDRRALSAAARREGTLIKCIRANLMAGWLTRTIGFQTALIVRHPCAVVESQYRSGSAWDPKHVLAKYRADGRLQELTGGRYRKLLDSQLTNLQALTLNWIIENQWPLERSQEDGYVVVYYEDLVAKPDRTWAQLCASLGLPRVPDVSLLQRPSQQASDPAVSQASPKWREPRWRTNLKPEQLDAIQGMLKATDFAVYNVNEVQPAAETCAGRI